MGLAILHACGCVVSLPEQPRTIRGQLVKERKGAVVREKWNLSREHFMCELNSKRV